MDGPGGIRGILRLLMVLVIGGLVGYLVWVGTWLGLVAWLATVIFLIDTSMNVLSGLLGETANRWGLLWYWVATVFGGQGSVLMAMKNGEIRTFRPAGRMGGLFFRFGAPSIVIVDAGVAAIFEQSGRFTRATGPGIVMTRRFERPAYVIDLRQQRREKQVKKITTRDGLHFDLERLEVTFEVASDFDADRGIYHVPQDALVALVYRGGHVFRQGGEGVEWGQQVLDYVEFVVRNVAQGWRLEDLVRADPAEPQIGRPAFLGQVQAQAQAGLGAVGVRLVRIDMSEITLPAELRDILSLPLKRQADYAWAEAQHYTIIEVARGLEEAFRLIRGSVEEVAGPTMPAVVVNLSEILQRVSRNFQELTAPYRAGGEVRRLLEGGPPPPAPQPKPSTPG